MLLKVKFFKYICLVYNLCTSITASFILPSTTMVAHLGLEVVVRSWIFTSPFAATGVVSVVLSIRAVGVTVLELHERLHRCHCRCLLLLRLLLYSKCPELIGDGHTNACLHFRRHYNRKRATQTGLDTDILPLTCVPIAVANVWEF